MSPYRYLFIILLCLTHSPSNLLATKEGTSLQQKKYSLVATVLVATNIALAISIAYRIHKRKLSDPNDFITMQNSNDSYIALIETIDNVTNEIHTLDIQIAELDTQHTALLFTAYNSDRYSNSMYNHPRETLNTVSKQLKEIQLKRDTLIKKQNELIQHHHRMYPHTPQYIPISTTRNDMICNACLTMYQSPETHCSSCTIALVPTTQEFS